MGEEGKMRREEVEESQKRVGGQVDRGGKERGNYK